MRHYTNNKFKYTFPRLLLTIIGGRTAYWPPFGVRVFASPLLSESQVFIDKDNFDSIFGERFFGYSPETANSIWACTILTE